MGKPYLRWRINGDLDTLRCSSGLGLWVSLRKRGINVSRKSLIFFKVLVGATAKGRITRLKFTKENLFQSCKEISRSICFSETGPGIILSIILSDSLDR